MKLASASELGKFSVPDAPIGQLDDFDAQLKMMFDLLALAVPG